MTAAARIFKEAPTRSGTTLETITPAMARQWLESNTANRPINDNRVLQYAQEMTDDRWVVNGETIKFSIEGILIDGQHRLRACDVADVTFQSYVVRGISDGRAFATVDVGETRTHGDIFYIAGFKDQSNVSAAAMLLYNYSQKKITIRSMGNKLPIPKEVLLEWALPRREHLENAVAFAQRSAARKLVPPSMIAASLVLFREKSITQAEQFIVDLGEGAGLTKTDAVYWLRERLIQNQASKERLPRLTVFALILKAWNKRRAGEVTKTLKLLDDEAFPRVK